jgi:hypothetical protein
MRRLDLKLFSWSGSSRPRGRIHRVAGVAQCAVACKSFSTDATARAEITSPIASTCSIFAA